MDAYGRWGESSGLHDCVEKLLTAEPSLWVLDTIFPSVFWLAEPMFGEPADSLADCFSILFASFMITQFGLNTQ